MNDYRYSLTLVWSETKQTSVRFSNSLEDLKTEAESRSDDPLSWKPNGVGGETGKTTSGPTFVIKDLKKERGLAEQISEAVLGDDQTLLEYKLGQQPGVKYPKERANAIKGLAAKHPDTMLAVDNPDGTVTLHCDPRLPTGLRSALNRIEHM